jgi:glycosyltransferase involved in cell wall biosynthesis
MPCICIVPSVEGIGGMATFRQKFEAGLVRRGMVVSHDPWDQCDAVLVIAGTRHLLPLLNARRRGVRIVQRLDGINWVHRRRNTGARHFLRAEYGNLILSMTRAHIATRILYQSEFTRRWWNEWYGKAAVESFVVHNGVDLDEYRPEGEGKPPADYRRLLVVEGNLGGGYDMGLDTALRLAEILKQKYRFPMELEVVGKINAAQREAVQSRAAVSIVWAGTVPRERIPEIDRAAHLLFSADLNAACPNSVIEAMACGLPVVAFNTGALNELIVGDSGRLVAYGGDPWQLDRPDVPVLADAAAEILRDRSRFSRAARAHAEEALGLERMVDGYLKVLLEA